MIDSKLFFWVIWGFAFAIVSNAFAYGISSAVGRSIPVAVYIVSKVLIESSSWISTACFVVAIAIFVKGIKL